MQPNVIKAYVGMVYQYHPDMVPDEKVSPSHT
jgi:DnaJ-class molecular chaperone